MAQKDSLSRAQIQSVTKTHAKRVHGRYFSLAAAPLPGEGTTALRSCVVSKKVSPLAAVRNRIKRQCRAALSPHLKKMKGTALICTAKRDATGASFRDMSADVAQLIARLA
jgi:ribonuclease P protein component